ncbi:MAG: sugar-binding domain-containing protein, partial [Streptosporangiaceae bacterium]
MSTTSIPPRLRFFALLLFAMISTAPSGADETMNLAGTWRFQLDRADAGRSGQWQRHELTGTFKLPGSLPERGVGDPVSVATKWTGSIFDKSWFTAPAYAPYRQPGNIKVPFWLQPETHYVGAAWFQRDIEIPADWHDRHVTLRLERPHWKTSVWLDDTALGSNDSLSVSHEYDLGAAVATGRHRLTVRVDNTLDPDIGENSHSVSDHTQGNWNGIVGRIELVATAPAWIEDLQVYPRLRDRVAVVRGRVALAGNRAMPASVRVVGAVRGAAVEPEVNAPVAADGSFAVEY